MKKLLLIFSCLGLLFSCATSQSHQSSTNSNRVKGISDTTLDTVKPKTSPGTCQLILSQCSTVKEQNNYFIIGKIEKTVAYGAGFTTIFDINQDIKVEIDTQQAQALKNKKKVNCTIREKETIGQTQLSFQLLKTNKVD
jgi:hypothetical protein